MASSKAHIFDSSTYKQSLFFKALSYPARIDIIRYLHLNGKASYQELCELFPLANETVSQHLKQLRLAGLIEMLENYPHSYYQLNQNACIQLLQDLQSFCQFFILANPNPAPRKD
jgi:ArsR family transcriptional regulator, arsenate/arsenite/antimonite-responsive transcriptional repressor